MRYKLNRILAVSLMTLALAGCKDSSVNGTPGGGGNSEAGASGGSATSPGSPPGTVMPANC